MTLLAVGISHRTAPVALLEQFAMNADDRVKALQELVGTEHVSEAVVLATCNRVEVYAVVTGFHGGLTNICALLSERAGCAQSDLANHLYVHYDVAAVEHAFRVATGLDSMVVGESQILGQLREAYHAATEADTAGRLLHELMQQALRVGKRAHAETSIDHVSRSLVGTGLARAATVVTDLVRARVVVVGAGSMSGLALATLRREGITDITVVNRTRERADRLQVIGVGVEGVRALRRLRRAQVERVIERHAGARIGKQIGRSIAVGKVHLVTHGNELL